MSRAVSLFAPKARLLGERVARREAEELAFGGMFSRGRLASSSGCGGDGGGGKDDNDEPAQHAPCRPVPCPRPPTQPMPLCG